MFSSLIKWKKFLKFDAGANDAKNTENCGSLLKEYLTSQLCAEGNRFSNQTQAPTIRKCRRRCVEHPDCNKIVKVPQLQIIDEVVKVPGAYRDRFR